MFLPLQRKMRGVWKTRTEYRPMRMGKCCSNRGKAKILILSSSNNKPKNRVKSWKELTIQINFRSAWTLDFTIGDSSESELQTPAEARFWDQTLSYCYTNGLLLHEFSFGFCVNRSCLMRVFPQKLCRTLNRVIFLAVAPFSQFYAKVTSTNKKWW